MAVRVLPIALAVAMLAGVTAPVSTANEQVEAVWRALEELQSRHRLFGDGDRQRAEDLRRALRADPEDDSEDSTVAECRGIGHAREPRVGLSPAVVPQLGRVVAPVLRFNALPGVGVSAQIARCLYMPLASIRRLEAKLLNKIH